MKNHCGKGALEKIAAEFTHISECRASIRVMMVDVTSNVRAMYHWRGIDLLNASLFDLGLCWVQTPPLANC